MSLKTNAVNYGARIDRDGPLQTWTNFMILFRSEFFHWQWIRTTDTPLLPSTCEEFDWEKPIQQVRIVGTFFSVFCFSSVFSFPCPANPREHDDVTVVGAAGLLVLGHHGTSSDKSSHAETEGRPRHCLLDPGAPVRPSAPVRCQCALWRRRGTWRGRWRGGRGGGGVAKNTGVGFIGNEQHRTN